MHLTLFEEIYPLNKCVLWCGLKEEKSTCDLLLECYLGNAKLWPESSKPISFSIPEL